MTVNCETVLCMTLRVWHCAFRVDISKPASSDTYKELHTDSLSPTKLFCNVRAVKQNLKIQVAT